MKQVKVYYLREKEEEKYYIKTDFYVIEISYLKKELQYLRWIKTADTRAKQIKHTDNLLINNLLKYFKGEKIDFSEMDLNLEKLTKLQKKVLNIVKKVKYNKRITYKEIGEKVNIRNYRIIGNIMAKNKYPIVIPCHRVVAQKGLGGYTPDIEIKKRLLRIEENGF